jgi:nitrate reductase NapE component
MPAFIAMPGLFESGCCGLMFIVLAVPLWKIFEKAGFPGAFGLLALLPVLNIIMFYYLAFSEWPALQAHIEREAYLRDHYDNENQGPPDPTDYERR